MVLLKQEILVLKQETWLSLCNNIDQCCNIDEAARLTSVGNHLYVHTSNI